MEIRKIFADLNDTFIKSPYGNPDVAAVHELDKEFPGVFRYAVNKLSGFGSWEDRVIRAFESLEGIPEFRYYDALEKVTEKVQVPDPVKKTFDKISDTVNEVIVISGCSDYALKTIVEKKLKPLLDANFILFGTKLNVGKDGCFKKFVKRIYGYSERAKIAKELKNGEFSVNIGDNKSNINWGMVREGDYGILLADWNKCDRKGNIFYARQKILPVVIDQILKEEKSTRKSKMFMSIPICKTV